jgi:error-prone DNA polymerase
LKKELNIIIHLGLEEFFLVVREVVEFARSRAIRCSGRGSAANSVVAYVLGITEVCPIQHRLLFERFLHEGRRGMPDIDVDFDSARRDEVITWMIDKWGVEHTAMTANVCTFRLRSAVREVAKTLGFPIAAINKTGKLLPHSNVRHVRDYRRELAVGLCDGRETPAIETLCGLVEQLADCPRHLSLHSGGMILSRNALRHISPIQTSANGVRQLQFAKDDVESLGLIKFDVLGLRMLSVISEAVTLINGRVVTADEDVSRVDLVTLDDPKAFDLIRSGETLALFQIESPGQWNLLSRTQPENFDDLVVQVALFRPGPLQGGMVHPLIARKRGMAPVTYPHPCLEPVLKDSYGVILFQEQVLEVAHVFADMSLSDADEFRRLMSKFRSSSEMEAMREKFVAGAINKHRVSRRLADKVFDLVAAFVGYGFCRSHAAAFARTVYQSAYLKAHYPAAYMAGIMEHKPGFFPEHTLLEEARRLGVSVLPACLIKSTVKYSLENIRGKAAIRIPLTQVQKISVEDAQNIVLERMAGPFSSIADAVWRLSLNIAQWENLARAGALDEFGSRRDVLVEARRALRGKPATDQYSLDFESELDLPSMPAMTGVDITEWDFETQSLTSGPHPISRQRSQLASLGALAIHSLREMSSGTVVLVGGIVISRQRPPTAKGMVFIIIEDESGRLPTAIIPEVYEKHNQIQRSAALLMEGKLEDGGPLAGNKFRSLLVGRMWSLDNVIGGAAGHPGENPRAGLSRR